MQVSIIIINYHTIDLVEKTIKSVIENTKHIDYEFIIVDNNSGDDLSRLEKLDLGLIRIFYLNENLGFGRANNFGASYATGKYLFFLNPDTLLRNNAIYYLVDALEQNMEYGIVGGNLFTIDGHPNLSYGPVLPSITDDLYGTTKNIFYKYYLKKNYFFNSTGKHKEVAYITGADMMMETELFYKVGGFDKRFFMYCEDADLSARMKDLGYKIVSVPSAEIIHLEGESVDFKEYRYKLTYEGRMEYFTIHHSRIYTLLANFLRFIYMLISCILYLGHLGKIKNQLKKVQVFLRVCF